MKKHFIKRSLQLFLTLCISLFTFFALFSQGTAINTTGAASDPSAMLDVSSSNKGFLTPRMTEAERIAIQSPARGLLVYQIDNDNGFWFFDGSSWLQANAGDNLGNHIADDSLDMTNKKIVNLATCTQNLDAANKEYVDNAVAAGGGGSSIPTMISNESSTGYTLSEAVQYCESLTESGYSDWHLPTIEEIVYFFGSSTSTNYLWTATISEGKENPVNQNYITARLSDGKWRNGGEQTSLLLARTVSGNTMNNTWTTVASLTPLSSGNLIIPTHMKFYGNRNSSSPCCQSSSFRLKFNFADGTSSYSSVFTGSTSSTTFVDMQSIPLLSSITPLSSIDVDIKSYATTVTSYATLIVSGYEISPSQSDGTVLPCRCVR